MMLYIKSLITIVVLWLSMTLSAQNPIEILLWPDDMLSESSVTIYQASNPNGLTVIMCPGGAYSLLSLAHEGHNMASWFNAQGITYAVLKYRMPNGHAEIPLSDAKQAIRIVRQYVAKEGMGTCRVGIMGASAGGHLAASLANLYDMPEERPDFHILLYPVISMKDGITHKYSKECLLGKCPVSSEVARYSMEEQTNENTPPAFIVLAADDVTVSPTNSFLYYQALTSRHVSACIHVYPHGGHGWGFNDSFPYKEQWTTELKKWLNDYLEQQENRDLAIAPLNGEHWWGGLTALGNQMPYPSNTKEYNLEKQNENNQIVPLLISSKGRYVYGEHPFRFHFRNDTLLLHSDFEKLSVVQAGKNLREAYLAASAKHFPASGKIPEELFFSKPQYNTWIELMYNQNQADIEAYAQQVLANDFPTGIFMIDDNWQNHYGNFDFKAAKFPDPKGMIERLHSAGFKIMLWVSPYVTADSPEARFLEEKGYLIKECGKDTPAILRWWNGSSACFDLTNPEAFEYLRQQLYDTQKKYGIDGFKFDAGDVMYMCGDNLKFSDPSANAAVFSQKWAEMGLYFPYNEYRTSFKMGGQPLVQRLGDKPYSWDAVSWLIPDMIAAGLLGHAYTCPDMIGGGVYSTFLNIDQDSFDQELIVRSCQIHAFMPMMQFSVAPWRILDKKHLEICQKFARFHEAMGTYFLETAKKSSQTGEPMVRHMEYMYPGQGFLDCKDQFMIGDKYMVAPMVTKGTSRLVKLPTGKWRDDQGKIYKGGKTISIQVPIERLPYFECIK